MVNVAFPSPYTPRFGLLNGELELLLCLWWDSGYRHSVFLRPHGLPSATLTVSLSVYGLVVSLELLLERCCTDLHRLRTVSSWLAVVASLEIPRLKNHHVFERALNKLTVAHI